MITAKIKDFKPDLYDKISEKAMLITGLTTKNSSRKHLQNKKS
jgi:hypothetical protein